jgi:hypothetical protein
LCTGPTRASTKVTNSIRLALPHLELFDAHRLYDVAEMRRRLETHLHWCNHARTHYALGGLLVPADRYHGRPRQ